MTDAGAADERAAAGFELGPDDLDYVLPDELIATAPADPRDAARLLVVSRSTDTIRDAHVRDLPQFLSTHDLLVLNDTTVIRARLEGRRVGSGGRVEGLYLDETEPGRWALLLRTNGRLRAGMRVELDGADGPSGVVLELMEPDDEAPGARPWWVAVTPPDAGPELLARAGHVPLPPYIRRARLERGDAAEVPADVGCYQTVYADPEHPGSIAAPTAGLHFTPELLERLTTAGVDRTSVTLHVGAGTFVPVTAPTLAAHPMHAERWSVSDAARAALTTSRDAGGRVIAVGTTSARTLESLPFDRAALPGPAGPCSGTTRLLMAPPYRFRHLDGLLTNFHLPRSTLLALVAALLGRDRTLALYEHAVRSGYRFYSYGDGMLILP